MQSFKLIAWKPWEELITQIYYPMLKANLKIVYYPMLKVNLKIV